MYPNPDPNHDPDPNPDPHPDTTSLYNSQSNCVYEYKCSCQRFTCRLGINHGDYCTPNFIRLRKLFARIARALSSQIYLAAN